MAAKLNDRCGCGTDQNSQSQSVQKSSPDVTESPQIPVQTLNLIAYKLAR